MKLQDVGQVDFRFATADDSPQIAKLHADSWRRNYRGAYSDAFLDGDVLDDRRQVWAQRLQSHQAQQITIVADQAGVVRGFAHTILKNDELWGALLDNLHVSEEVIRHGVGTRLMAETAREVIHRGPGSALYLWVLQQNTRAQSFYLARGGTCAGSKLGGPFPGGGQAPVLRFAWADPSVLTAVT